MICIEPLGTEVFLPAILIGYELPDAVSDEQLDRLTPQDDRIVEVFQQAGGMCMSYPRAVGTLLRLEANLDRGIRPLGPLVRGLKAMAEDPDMKLLSQFPVLRELVATRGQPYTRAELDRLSAYLGVFLELPPIASGIEAFVRFAACAPTAHFGGWKALRCRPCTPTLRHFESGNTSELRRDDNSVLGGSLMHSIIGLGPQLGLHARPAVFLLWENSD